MNLWTIDLPYKKYIILTLGFVLAGLITAYGVFLQSTVDKVVERGDIKDKIADIRSDIGNAEKTFGSHVGAATLSQAREIGLKQTEASRFVTRSIDANSVASADVQN